MIKDEVKIQTDKMKNMTAKQKAGYIADYYKWPIIITIAVVAGLIAFIHSQVTKKTNVLYCEMINSNLYYDTQTTMMTDFAATEKDFDPKHEEMYLGVGMNIDYNNADNVTLSYQEKLAAEYNVGDIDITIANKAVISQYAQMEAYADLSSLLPADLYKELQDKGYKFYTCTLTDDNGKSYTAPVGIYIKDCPVFKKGCEDESGNNEPVYPEADGYEPIFTIAFNSSHTDYAIDFLRFLISDQ